MTSTWIKLALTLPLFSFGVAACQGGSSGNDGQDGDGPGGSGGMTPPSDRSLNRNPDHPLVCDKPLGKNPVIGQLVRLTNVEVTNSVRDLLFGTASDRAPKNDLPVDNTAGFSNNVANQFSAQKLLVEGFDRMFADAAAKAAANPQALAGCSPKSADEELTCGKKFIAEFGRRAWRRPLKEDEKKRLEDFFAKGRTDFGFSGALETTVAAMLQSPQFVYRLESGIGSPDSNSVKNLSSHEIATRLSYFLTNSIPDAELVAAADKDQLRSAGEIEKHATRLLSGSAAREIATEFHSEYLDLPRWNRLARSKDAKAYPNFKPETAASLEAGLGKYVDEMFWSDGANLTDFLSAPVAWVDKNSAPIYGVQAPDGSNLAKVSLDETKWGGVLTQAGLMAGMGHTTEQASIIRGAVMLEKILCAPSPPPPPNVSLIIPPAPTGEKLTYRQRVERTVEVGSCRSCHVKIDGVGFLFENYDGVGAYQTTEQGLPVNASGKLEGTLDMDGSYANIVEALKPIAKSEQVAQCVAEHWYSYAMSRAAIEEDGCEIAAVTDAFVESKGNFQTMLVAIAKSKAFRTTTSVPFND